VRLGRGKKLKGDVQYAYRLEWNTFTHSKSGWREPRETAENGGIGIGILLILELSEYQVIEQSVMGPGLISGWDTKKIPKITIRIIF